MYALFVSFALIFIILVSLVVIIIAALAVGVAAAAPRRCGARRRRGVKVFVIFFVRRPLGIIAAQAAKRRAGGRRRRARRLRGEDVGPGNVGGVLGAIRRVDDPNRVKLGVAGGAEPPLVAGRYCRGAGGRDSGPDQHKEGHNTRIAAGEGTYGLRG